MTDYQPYYANTRALIIGIDVYQDPRFNPLGEAERDASLLAETLSADPYGFQVESLLGAQATRQAILDALFELQHICCLDDCVLIYFSGHGYTLTTQLGHETGYLACADTIPERHHTALRMDELTGTRDYNPAKHIAFILDACFSGAALGLTRQQSVSAESFLLRRAYQVLSAGAPDQAVADYHSMTAYLLPMLQEPMEMVTLGGLATQLRDIVTVESRGKQIPLHGHIMGSQGGEFVFYAPREGKPIDKLPESVSKGLRDENARVRYYAIGDASRLLNDVEHGENARAALEELVTQDPDSDVRRRAFEALREPALPPEIASTEIDEPVVAQPEPQIAEELEAGDDLHPAISEIQPRSFEVPARAQPKRRSAPTMPLVALLGLGFIGVGIIALLIFVFSLWGDASLGPRTIGVPAGSSDVEVKHAQYTEPIDNAESAQVALYLSAWYTEIRSIAGGDSLFNAEVDYAGEMNFQHSGSAHRSIALAEQSLNYDFSFLELDGSQYRWDIGLSPEVPIDLNVYGASGSNVMNLADLILTSFTYDGGSGSAQIHLPASEQMIDATLYTGSGSVQVSLANGANTSLEINGGSGSVNVIIGSNAIVDGTFAPGSGGVNIQTPAGVPLRIEATDYGSGSFNMPGGLALVDDLGDNKRNTGVWESAGYSPGTGITLTFSGGGFGSINIH